MREFERELSMASCEPWRQTAYAEDLRWRMVWQREALGYTYWAIASNLSVDKSTVLRTLELFHATGSVSKRSYHPSDTNRILTLPAQLFLLNLVVSKPGIYLKEIQKGIKWNIRQERDTHLAHANKQSDGAHLSCTQSHASPPRGVTP